MTEALLEVRDLRKEFAAGGARGRRGRVVAVAGVSFSLSEGETLALVGESGSGKTTTVRIVLRLIGPDRGTVRFDGLDWLSLPPGELNRQRRKIGVVFQDPATSLDPKMTVEQIVTEPLAIHRMGDRAARRRRAAELLESVGLPGSALSKRPAEFSGGQRQRIAIARALSTSPKLMVLDEPVSALDVSVRAQVLNLLADIRGKADPKPASLFIGHDLSVVAHVADRTAVMYLGRIVEEGPTEALFRSPRHHYTALLLASQPRTAPGGRPAEATGPQQEPASAAAVPSGCPFHPRCPAAMPRCRQEMPAEVVEEQGTPRRFSCFEPLETFLPRFP